MFGIYGFKETPSLKPTYSRTLFELNQLTTPTEVKVPLISFLVVY
jgi:hypothetical protein